MKTKKNIIVIVVVVISLIIISSLILSNAQLTDRVFYRLGFQDQVCFSIIDDWFENL